MKWLYNFFSTKTPRGEICWHHLSVQDQELQLRLFFCLPPTSYVTVNKPRQILKPQYPHLKKKNNTELYFRGQSPRVAFNKNVDVKIFSLWSTMSKKGFTCLSTMKSKHHFIKFKDPFRCVSLCSLPLTNHPVSLLASVSPKPVASGIRWILTY